MGFSYLQYIEGKEDLLYKTFFAGNHMKETNFDKNFDKEIESTYYKFFTEEEFNQPFQHTADEINSCTGTDPHLLPNLYLESIDPLNVEISLEELHHAIKCQKTTVKSFDCDSFHPIMIANLPPIAIKILHKCFNLALENEHWLWDVSNIVFIKKLSKANYMKPGAYRPISVSSYVGKLLERILERRLKTYLMIHKTASGVQGTQVAISINL